MIANRETVGGHNRLVLADLVVDTHGHVDEIGIIRIGRAGIFIHLAGGIGDPVANHFAPGRVATGRKGWFANGKVHRDRIGLEIRSTDLILFPFWIPARIIATQLPKHVYLVGHFIKLEVESTTDLVTNHDNDIVGIGELQSGRWIGRQTNLKEFIRTHRRQRITIGGKTKRVGSGCIKNLNNPFDHLAIRWPCFKL